MITLSALAITLSVAAPVTTPQSVKARADADLKELSTYTLSMDTLNKLDRAMRTFAVEIKKDPKFQEVTRLEAEMKALEKKFEDEPTDADQKRYEAIEARIDVLKGEGSLNMSDAQTINDLAAKIQKLPAMASALQREGLSPREYAKFMMAMLQAGLAAGLQKAGMLKELPEGTNPANVKWIVEHEAELKKLQESWGSLMK